MVNINNFVNRDRGNVNFHESTTVELSGDLIERIMKLDKSAASSVPSASEAQFRGIALDIVKSVLTKVGANSLTDAIGKIIQS